MSDDNKKEVEKGGIGKIVFEINYLIEKDISEAFYPKNKNSKSNSMSV